MFDIAWMDFLILILASFRLTHLLVFDEIASFIRKPFITVIFEEDELGRKEETLQIKGTGIRHFIGSMLSCYWCTGVWVSLGVVFLYFYIPVLYPLFIVLAVAGAAAIIESKV